MRVPLLLTFLLLAPAALAQREPPACTAAREGMVACFGEKLCECRYERGGSVSGRRRGFHWDCGVLRPSCGTVPAGPGAEVPPLSVMPLIQPQQGGQGIVPGIDPRLMPQSGAGAVPYGTR